MRHIEFCLEEIQSEIDALDRVKCPVVLRTALAGHVAGMRAIIEAAAAVPSDDLTLIRGIGAADVALLADKGVRTFAAIAAWRRTDITALAGDSDLAGRISEENWIEQAAILAAGGSTSYADASSASAAAAGSVTAPIAPEPVVQLPVAAAPVANAAVAAAPVTTVASDAAPAADTTPNARGALSGLRRIAAALLIIAGLGALNTTNHLDRISFSDLGHQLVALTNP